MARTTEKIFLGVLLVSILALGSMLVSALTSKKVDLSPAMKITDKQIETVAVSNVARISADQVRQIALRAVNTNTAGEITDVELENAVYTVEFRKNGIETDVKIDAENGNVLSIENDNDETEENDLSPAELNTIKPQITAEKAKEIALKTVRGKITDFEIEKENGQWVYAIEISSNGVETEVKVSASTGKVIEIEREDDEEDDD